MRQFLLILLTVMGTSCNYERVFIGDVDRLTDNQMKNNRIEIDKIKEEIKQFKIENRKKNILLIDNLDKLHLNVQNLNDSIDLVSRSTALDKAIDFINRNFDSLNYFNEVQLQIDQDTPRPLLKLHISTLEAALIMESKEWYDYPDDGIKLDRAIAQIKPSKIIIKGGEELSGHLILGAEANFNESKKSITKVTLNGREIFADKEGWKFEIAPTSKEKGLLRFELSSEIIINDTDTIKGSNTITIQN